MTLPVFARKVKKLASFQLFNLKLLLNGESSRGFNKFKKHYKLKGELGRGGFGIVYRAVRVGDELPVAVKFIDRRTVREWGKINDEQVPMEICMLAKCSKIKGVIRLIDWYSIPEGYLIVMERPYPCVDMFDFIKGQQKLDEEMARLLFRQIAQTLYECSQKRVLHRDLKDENIVIDLVTGDTKLIDFGAATVLKKSHYTDFQGTRLYCPPEWFLHSLYLGKEAAVWSLGVLLYNSLNGRLPFKNEKDICTAHLLGPLPFYTAVSAEAKDLIARCLAFDPFSRCSLEEILKHPWLTKPSADWLTLSAAAGKNLQEKPKEDERDHSEELEEIAEEVEKEEKDDEEGREEENENDVVSTEAESGVGSSASSSTVKTATQNACGTVAMDRQPPQTKRHFAENQPGMLPTPPTRFSKTSLLAAPSSDELKAVVHASKTKSVYHGVALRPSRRHVQPPNSAVLTALRRAMSRDRQIRA